MDSGGRTGNTEKGAIIAPRLSTIGSWKGSGSYYKRVGTGVDKRQSCNFRNINSL